MRSADWFWVSTAMVALASAAHASGDTTPPGAGYELMFADEFNGDRVDLSVWDPRVGERTGPGIDSFNRAEDVWLEKGDLVIRASTGVVDGKKRHFGGGLISKRGFGYGYYVVRSKPAMAGAGVHSAFWQRGLSTGSYKNVIFEIDSYEIDSPLKIATNNLFVDPNGYGFKSMPWPYRSNIPVELDRDGWFVDAFEYAPDGITFYDNGKVVAVARYPKDFPDLVAQQNIWLTALNGVGRVDEATQPDYTRFDYFRYYAKDYPGHNLLPNGTFEYNRDQVPLQLPVAWKEEGSVTASAVVKGAARGASYLRHSAQAAFEVRTLQPLYYLRNGKYKLSFGYRTSARIESANVVIASGGRNFAVALKPSTEWKMITLRDIDVTDHSPVVTLHTRGLGGQFVDFDNVEFFKPVRGRRPETPIFDVAKEPLWEIFTDAPMRFTGDEKFFFFDRTLGYGDAVTAQIELRAASLQNAMPMLRAPRSGRDGWAIGVTADGGAYCLKGSLTDHYKLASAAAYRPGRAVTITCSYEAGTVSMRVDGRTVARASAPGYGTSDKTAAGRLGATVARYDTTGDVTVMSDHASPTDKSLTNFRGDIANVKVWNRTVAERR